MLSSLMMEVLQLSTVSQYEDLMERWVSILMLHFCALPLPILVTRINGYPIVLVAFISILSVYNMK